LVDSTGLKLCGGGEWLIEKHGTKTRRAWRQLLGHTAGGRPGEMLAARLAIPASDNTILRQLKRRAATRAKGPMCVVGIDDWSWRKG
jgi:hypothetical protein